MNECRPVGAVADLARYHSGATQHSADSMTYPTRSEVELPILLEVAAAGGELRPNTQFFKEIAKYFTGLTDQDLVSTNRTGINTWENRVHWARLALVHKEELDRSTYGDWRTTDKGRLRIENEVGRIEVPVKKEETVHTRLARMLEEIGHSFGKYAKRELKRGALRVRCCVEGSGLASALHPRFRSAGQGKCA